MEAAIEGVGASASGVAGLRSMKCRPGRWIVLHTKSRQEKAVARHLSASGRSHYLPTVARTSMVRGRKFQSHKPLFPSYVFLWGSREDGFAAIATKRVCRLIEIADQSRFEVELLQIAGVLDQGASLDLYPFAAVGQRCRVNRGPFRGVEGRVTERTSPMRLVLEIGILGRGAALEIEADFVEPLDEGVSPHR